MAGVDGKNVSISVSELFQVTKYIYMLFESCCFKMFIKLSSSEKYNLQGTFIPFPSPWLMAFPVISKEHVFVSQARRKFFVLVDVRPNNHPSWSLQQICPLYFLARQLLLAFHSPFAVIQQSLDTWYPITYDMNSNVLNKVIAVRFVQQLFVVWLS